jgi:predicted HTH transcriptional regulator
MEITTNKIKSIAMIGFDTLKGPVIEWKKQLTADFSVDIDQFCTPFYLMFQSGNGIKPRAIFFEDFYVVAFSEEMNLLLLFLDGGNAQQNYNELLKFAKRYYPESYAQKPKEKSVKDNLFEMLKEQQKMTISELGKYFKFNKTTIRRYLLELVLSGKIKRDGKKGRETLWSINTE